jgi:hypothetical protein
MGALGVDNWVISSHANHKNISPCLMIVKFN